MYIQEKDYSPDYYDSVKIAQDIIKNKPNKKPMVKMAKQTKRDFDDMWKNSEAYRNIKRENDRSDYIQRLLNETL